MNDYLNKQFFGRDFDQVLLNISINLLKNGITTKPRDQKILEFINCTYTIYNPLMSIIENPHRKLSKNYIKKELEWYLSGDLKIDMIKDYAKMWDMIKNPDGTVNSNYGYFIWHQRTPDNTNQFMWAYDSLIKDKDSRQSLINLNQVSHKYEGNKDFVCTETIQFFIRDNSLQMIINMRSQDLIFGACNDIPFFSYVYLEMYSRLLEKYNDLKIGKMITNCGSLHVYERHFEMLNKISSDNFNYISTSINQLLAE